MRDGVEAHPMPQRSRIFGAIDIVGVVVDKNRAIHLLLSTTFARVGSLEIT